MKIRYPMMFAKEHDAEINKWSFYLFVIALGWFLAEIYEISAGRIELFVPIRALIVLCLAWSIKRYISRTAALVLFAVSIYNVGDLLSDPLGYTWLQWGRDSSHLLSEFVYLSVGLSVATSVGLSVATSVVSGVLLWLTWIDHRTRETKVLLMHLFERLCEIAMLLMLTFMALFWLLFGGETGGFDVSRGLKFSVIAILLLAETFLLCCGLIPGTKNRPISLPKIDANQIDQFGIKSVYTEQSSRLFTHRGKDGNPVFQIAWTYYTLDESDYNRFIKWSTDRFRSGFNRYFPRTFILILAVVILTFYLDTRDYGWPVLMLPGMISLIGYLAFTLFIGRRKLFQEFETSFPNATPCKKSDIFHKRNTMENFSALVWNKKKNVWAFAGFSALCLMQAFISHAASNTADAIGWFSHWSAQAGLAFIGLALAIFLFRTWQIKSHFYKEYHENLTPESLAKVRDAQDLNVSNTI